MLTVEQFDAYIVKLQKHNWYYDFSDDNNVWKRGKEVRKELLDDAAQHKILQQAFIAWEKFVFTSGARSKALLELENAISKLRGEITNV